MIPGFLEAVTVMLAILSWQVAVARHRRILLLEKLGNLLCYTFQNVQSYKIETSTWLSSVNECWSSSTATVMLKAHELPSPSSHRCRSIHPSTTSRNQYEYIRYKYNDLTMMAYYIYARIYSIYIYIISNIYFDLKKYTQVWNKHKSNETQQRPNKTSSNKKTNAKDPKGHPNPLVRCLVEFFLPCFNKSSIVGDSFNLIQAQILAIWHTSMGAGEASAILEENCNFFLGMTYISPGNLHIPLFGRGNSSSIFLFQGIC